MIMRYLFTILWSQPHTDTKASTFTYWRNEETKAALSSSSVAVICSVSFVANWQLFFSCAGVPCADRWADMGMKPSTTTSGLLCLKYLLTCCLVSS